MKKITTVDCHFHTKNSDGGCTNKELLEVIKNTIGKGSLLIPTEHDFVNEELTDELLFRGYKTRQGVEISTRDYGYNDGEGKSMHMTCYSSRFREEALSLLEEVRAGRRLKLISQIKALNSQHGFDCDYDDMIDYCVGLGFNPENLNNWHLSNYILSKEKNRELIKINAWDPHMKAPESIIFSESYFRKYYLRNLESVWVTNYEPPPEVVSEQIKTSNAILAIAHPNFTFKSIEEFEAYINQFRGPYKQGNGEDYVIQGIEIGSRASKQWVEAIIRLAYERGMILTFGSDCHDSYKRDIEKRKKAKEILKEKGQDLDLINSKPELVGEDPYHGIIGDINPYVPPEVYQENIHRLLDMTSR